jgi:MraZ protein
MEELSARLETLEEFSDEHENLAALMFASSQRLPFDTEGRIVLPPDLAEHAFITDSAAFVGLGKSFQIWEPGRFAVHLESLRERARQQETKIPPLGAAPGRRRE